MRIRAMWLAPLFCLVLTGCSVKQSLRRLDDRYATPGAMDSPLTGVYSTYTYPFMHRYRITHEWVNTAACVYRSMERPNLPNGRRSNVYDVPHIYESDGKTWQDSSTGRPQRDFDRWVRSVKRLSRDPAQPGEEEVGFHPLCFEFWWGSSHFLRIRMHRRSLDEFEAFFTESYPEGTWRSESINGLQWRVQSVADDLLRPPPLNGIGGPYRTWIVALGESGYAMSFEMGASKLSLAHPQAHAALERVLMRLVHSLKIEPLSP
jgi:hypothetical protein